MKKPLVMAAIVAVVITLGTATAVAQDSSSTTKFCNANWKLSAAFNSIPDEPTPAQQKKIQNRINAILDDAEASVPEEIQSQVTAAAAVLRQGLETAFEDPNLEQYGNEIDAWAADNCDYQVVDVTATEYAFEGIPKTLDPGRTVFRFTNEGAEIHELVLARIKTDTPLKVLLNNEKRANKETEDAGFAFAAQGETAYAYATLKKDGRYVALCFVPVGTVDLPDGPPDPSAGPPHLAEGMVQEFKTT